MTYYRRACFLLFSAILSPAFIFADDVAMLPSNAVVEPSRNIENAVVLWQEKHLSPEPLAIHIMRIDLQNSDYETIVMVGDDPDGDGPAEASLTYPADLMNRDGAVAGVNANAFARVRDQDRFRHWHEGMPVNMLGMVTTHGTVRSMLENPKRSKSEVAFWANKQSLGTIGRPSPHAYPQDSVGDFYGLLLSEGNVIPNPGGERHPRTALGIDKTRRYLFLAVVDGRRPGYSVGATLEEMAKIMKKHGCHSAINMDGGGSSIMMYRRDQKEKLHTFNRPSSGEPRPIPVMIGVRRKKPQDAS